MTDHLFIHASLPDSDRELFFGPLDKDDKFTTFGDPITNMAHIAHIMGIFPSVTQAKKNGWDKPIPRGFSIHQHKKTKRNIFILNVFEEQ